MYGVELIIICVACFGSALSASSGTAVSLVGTLICWRLIMGVGIGGDVSTIDFDSTLLIVGEQFNQLIFFFLVPFVSNHYV